MVLGAGRRAEDDVDLDSVRKDGVPVRKRRGGGGTVVLSPGQVVLAVVTEVSSPFHNREYAAALGGWFVEALESAGADPSSIVPRGISDLAVGDRKILGSSVYRSRGLFFYQGSLLVSIDVALFSRYLRYPSRVPAYRRGRDHGAFCTTLHEQRMGVSVPDVLRALEAVTKRRLPLFT